MELTLRRPALAMPLRLLAIVLALLLLLIAAMSVPFLFGTRSLPATVVGEVKNGLIAMERSDDHIGILDPSTQQSITRLGPCCLSGPDWSPDGAHLALWSSVGQIGGRSLLIDNADFSDSIQASLTVEADDVPAARWSPDGSRLAVIASVGGEPRLSIVTASDGSVTPVEVGAAVTDASWHPDGTRLLLRLVIGDTISLRVVDLDDGSIGPVIAASDVTSEFHATDHGQSDLYGPTLSPDGSMIAFTQGVLVGPGHAPRDFPYSRSYVMRADGTSIRSLDPTEELDDVDGVTWSPEGDRLSVHLRQGAYDRIEVITLDGSRPPVVSDAESNVGGTVSHLWSPDGTVILTVRSDGRSALIEASTGITTEAPWLVGPSGWRPTAPADWQPVIP